MTKSSYNILLVSACLGLFQLLTLGLIAQEGVEEIYTIEVLEPGSKPLKPLRFRFDTKSEISTRMEYEQGWTSICEDIEVTKEFDGEIEPESFGEHPFVFPPFAIQREFSIGSAPDMGTEIITRFVGHDLDLENSGLSKDQRETISAAGWKRSLEGAAGMQTSRTVDPQGRVIDHVGLSDDKLKAMWLSHQWLFRPFEPVFPEEPIGKGARWTVYANVSSCCGNPDQRGRADFLLRKIEGDRLWLDIEVRLAPLDLKQDLPIFDPEGREVEAAQQIEYFDYSATGRGEMVVDLTRPAPLSSELRVDMKTRSQSTFPMMKVLSSMSGSFIARGTILEPDSTPGE